MLTVDELQLLAASQADKSRQVEVVVTGCAWECCGKGWQRRDGYEQTYQGWVDNLEFEVSYADGVLRSLEPVIPSPAHEAKVERGSFMLYASGIGGGLTYVVACRLFEVAEVRPF